MFGTYIKFHFGCGNFFCNQAQNGCFNCQEFTGGPTFVWTQCKFNKNTFMSFWCLRSMNVAPLIILCPPLKIYFFFKQRCCFRQERLSASYFGAPPNTSSWPIMGRDGLDWSENLAWFPGLVSLCLCSLLTSQALFGINRPLLECVLQIISWLLQIHSA